MTKPILVAAVVFALAVTPTWLDAWQVWQQPEKFQTGIDPHALRTLILAWYLAVLVIALLAWRLFV